MARPINEYYPHPLETSFENWREFKHGTSNHPDYDDDLWQAVYFEHYSKLQTASLRKYLKYNPEKKGGFSFKVRLNLALMDIEEFAGKKLLFSLLVVLVVAIATEYYDTILGWKIRVPRSVQITIGVCWISLLLIRRLVEKLPISFFPYSPGKKAYLFSICKECDNAGTKTVESGQAITCRNCNAFGEVVYFGDPEFAFDEDGNPWLDETKIPLKNE